jgi:hypothetical protein
MLTGSFASSLHGAPRTTQDIDVVIDPTPRSLLALVQQFPVEDYYVSEEAAREALAIEGMFNVIDLTSGWKIDFILRKSRPFSREEFGRRRTAELLGMPISVASPEDVVVAKLEWAKLGESERQIDDAAAIVRTQGAALDLEYVARWVAALGLTEPWARATKAAGRGT